MTYTNTSDELFVNICIFHRCLSISDTFSGSIVGVCTFNSSGWSLGNTYTMPSFSTTGSSTKSVSVSCSSYKVARVKATVPANSTVRFYSTSTSNRDVYGYLTNTATGVNSSSGAPTGTIVS